MSTTPPTSPSPTSTPAPTSGAGVNRALAGFRLVEIRQGDTLHTIAARELSDAAKWADLIAINGLDYPYLTGDPALAGRRVRLYGQLLMVPAATARAPAATDPSAVYGTDLALQNGQLVVGDGDFAIVSGVANLRQALLNRLGTSLRELLFHLDYGNGARGLVGRVAGPTVLQLAAQYVKACLTQETRLSSVDSVAAAVSGDATSVSASVTPIASAPISIQTTV